MILERLKAKINGEPAYTMHILHMTYTFRRNKHSHANDYTQHCKANIFRNHFHLIYIWKSKKENKKVKPHNLGFYIKNFVKNQTKMQKTSTLNINVNTSV